MNVIAVPNVDNVVITARIIATELTLIGSERPIHWPILTLVISLVVWHQWLSRTPHGSHVWWLKCLLDIKYFLSLDHDFTYSIVYFPVWLTDGGCECEMNHNFYRPVSANNCRSFIQSLSSGNVAGTTFHCPGNLVFDTTRCTCAFSGVCPSNCQGGGGH